ncbi:hypothetical protein NRIC_25390 [Enterococcus florum]|uniref:Uncharacterized protein n=1 Tax=Enterococcus florum TaxID=2480627 RepID=A0A4P5PEP6_9ENTE|nr:hypothetical protein [Enterococcus florum]GCF94648.1 hypothetical protein NRIC_25390 [Enterococcus florum]
MSKVVIYPFDKGSEVIVSNRKHLIDLEISQLICPNGWGYKSYDGVNVDHNFNANCDLLIIPEYENEINFEIEIIVLKYIG